MATYQVETDNGTYQVETEDAPQWSDIPKNAVEGIKETPQTALGLVKSAKMGVDLTSPFSIGRSALQAATGTPLAQTDTGEAVQGVIQGNKDNIQGIKDAVSDPLGFAKRQIIEHPISTALTAAGAVGTAAPFLEGSASTAAKYAGRMGENEMGKLHGTSQGQFRQLGREDFGNVMRSSYDHGDANLLQGPIGREEAIKERIKQLGSDLGGVREQASAAGPAMSGEEMANAIKEKIGPDYSPSGVNFSQEGQLEAQLNSIKAMKDPTIEDYSQRVTDTNHQAAKNKLVQPTNVETDVANQMAHINDEQIAKRLPPEIQEHYKTLKEEFGNAKSLQPMELRGEGKEALGKSSDNLAGMVKNAAHAAVGGPKMGAQIGFGAEKVFKGTAGIMSQLASSPASFGKYAAPLLQAMQRNGEQGVAAMHFLLSQQHPDYNDLRNSQ